MDVNGTRFHLLLGEADWTPPAWVRARPGAPHGIVFNRDRQELTLCPAHYRFAAHRTASELLGLDARRGAAADRYGNWYWIDEPGTGVLVRSVGDGAVTPFWPAADPAPAPPQGPFRPAQAEIPAPPVPLAGLAVTADHYLVVGVLEPGGLLVFDLQAGGPPERWRWPEGVPFAPFDIAAPAGGGALILDRANRRLWELDRRLLVITRRPADPEAPAPAFTPGSPRTCTGPPVLADALDLGPLCRPALTDPIAVEVTSESTAGTILILLRGNGSGVLAVRDGGLVGVAELPVTAHDLALVSDPDRLYVTDEVGDQAYEFLATWDDGFNLAEPEIPRYHPMRLFSGKALVAANGVAHYDLGSRFVPVGDQCLVRYDTWGEVETGVLDGDEPGCVWHRLLADGSFPSESGLRVWSAASDDRELVEQAPDWRLEPDPLPRAGGPELPFVDLGDRLGTVETLLQHARGRYLRLRLELTGNGQTTPRLRAVRVWFPRFSYRDHYLPAAYRDEPGSASFVDRFLANPEGILTALEDRIAAAYGLFDPRITPDGALEWLASWFDLALDPAWDPPRRRLLLRHASTFFAWRGTIRGLHAALALVLDPCVGPEIFGPYSERRHGVRLVELYQTRSTTDPLLPETGAEATRLWRSFLARRYGTANAARAAHGLPPGPDQIDLPAEAPDQEPARGDWYRLHTIVLPAARTAHRFRVLLPASISARPGGPATSAEVRTQRVALVRRILELEKPAHTEFEVRFYWDAFRIGEARLGLDTIADLGSRSPDLLIEAVLGGSHLGAQYLADPMAATAATRPTGGAR